MIPNDMFVANDTFLDNHSNRIAIITGPNMAGLFSCTVILFARSVISASLNSSNNSFARSITCSGITK